jgi:1,4-alpha-glucan branching enzyme
VLVNFSNTSFANYTIGLPRGGNWSVVFNSDWNGYGSDYGNTFTAGVTAQANPLHGLGFRGTFALGPYSAVILTLNPASGSFVSGEKSDRRDRPSKD